MIQIMVNQLTTEKKSAELIEYEKLWDEQIQYKKDIKIKLMDFMEQFMNLVNHQEDTEVYLGDGHAEIECLKLRIQTTMDLHASVSMRIKTLHDRLF